MPPLKMTPVRCHRDPVAEDDQRQHHAARLFDAWHDEREQAHEQPVDPGDSSLRKSDKKAAQDRGYPLNQPERGEVMKHRAAPPGYIALPIMDIKISKSDVRRKLESL